MLTYKGDGKQHIAGVPAQDLDEDTISRLAADFNLSVEQFKDQLIAGGLYSAPKTKKKSTKEVKDSDDGLRTESLSQDTD